MTNLEPSQPISEPTTTAPGVEQTMLRECRPDEAATIAAIINDAARAYQGVIPDDRWHEPYMPLAEVQREIAAGVIFWGCELDGQLVGVMGIQHVQDVALIRHAYVRTAWRRQGIGSELLQFLTQQTQRCVLVGTWAAARWAVAFYQRHGFTLVDTVLKNRLLQTYWSIPARQVETSVVLVDQKWLARSGSKTGHAVPR